MRKKTFMISQKYAYVADDSAFHRDGFHLRPSDISSALIAPFLGPWPLNHCLLLFDADETSSEEVEKIYCGANYG